MVDFDISNLKLDGLKGKQASSSGFKIDEKAKLDADIQACFRSGTSDASEEMGLTIASSSTTSSKKSSKKASSTDSSSKSTKTNNDKGTDELSKRAQASNGTKAQADEFARFLGYKNSDEMMKQINDKKELAEDLYKARSTKKASNGMTYEEAENKIIEIRKKNQENKECYSSKDHVYKHNGEEWVLGQDVYLDENKFSDEDKKELAEAKKAQEELEKKYPGIGKSAKDHELNEKAKNMYWIGKS